jgi:hypothetical protein
MHCDFTSCTLAPCLSGPDSNLQTVPEKVQTTSCCPDSSKPLVAFAIPRVFSFSSRSRGRYQNGQKWTIIALKRTLSMQPWGQSYCPPRPQSLSADRLVEFSDFCRVRIDRYDLAPCPEVAVDVIGGDLCAPLLPIRWNQNNRYRSRASFGSLGFVDATL